MATLTNMSKTLRISIDLVKRGGEMPFWYVCDVHAERKDLTTEKWISLFALRKEYFEEQDVLQLMEDIRDIVDDREREFVFVPIRDFFELRIVSLASNTLECNLLLDLQWELSKTVLDDQTLDPGTISLSFQTDSSSVIKFAEELEFEHHACLR